MSLRSKQRRRMRADPRSAGTSASIRIKRVCFLDLSRHLIAGLLCVMNPKPHNVALSLEIGPEKKKDTIDL